MKVKVTDIVYDTDIDDDSTTFVLNSELPSEEELEWDSDDGIELREGLGRYWPEDAEDEVECVE